MPRCVDTDFFCGQPSQEHPRRVFAKAVSSTALALVFVLGAAAPSLAQYDYPPPAQAAPPPSAYQAPPPAYPAAPPAYPALAPAYPAPAPVYPAPPGAVWVGAPGECLYGNGAVYWCAPGVVFSGFPVGWDFARFPVVTIASGIIVDPIWFDGWRRGRPGFVYHGRVATEGERRAYAAHRDEYIRDAVHHPEQRYEHHDERHDEHH